MIRVATRLFHSHFHCRARVGASDQWSCCFTHRACLPAFAVSCPRASSAGACSPGIISWFLPKTRCGCVISCSLQRFMFVNCMIWCRRRSAFNVVRLGGSPVHGYVCANSALLPVCLPACLQSCIVPHLLLHCVVNGASLFGIMICGVVDSFA